MRAASMQPYRPLDIVFLNMPHGQSLSRQSRGKDLPAIFAERLLVFIRKPLWHTHRQYFHVL